MGGDGGCINTRADMVRTKGYGFTNQRSCGMGTSANHVSQRFEEAVDMKKVIALRMTTCAISQGALKAPIVGCKLGKLYNKDVVIERLLKKQMPSHSRHIRALKDVVDVCAQFSKDEEQRIFCDVTMQDLNNGVVKSSFLWECGCLMASKAIKESASLKKGEKNDCPRCGKAYETEISCAMDADETLKVRERLDAEWEAVQAERAARKKKKAEEKGGAVDEGEKKAKKAKVASDEAPKKKKDDGKSEVWKSLFHDKTKEAKTDAFGHSWSNRGVGL